MSHFYRRSLVTIVLSCVTAYPAHAEDLVEFLSGAKARGTVREIRKEEEQLDFEIQMGDRRLLRTYTFDKIHAVTRNGKRHVLNQSDQGAAGTPTPDSTTTRSEADVLKLIDTLGNTPPDWFASTSLDYPPTLELDWPLKPAEEGWNNQKNVGQFKWDVIHPNPGRWRSGVRLIHEIMKLHKDKPVLLQRDMRALGEMYFELFQDYARAAFWLRRAQVEIPQPQSVYLAECYWRLGNRQMALEILSSRRLPMNAIKLLGEMGQTDRATRLAESFVRSYPERAHEPYLLAGDACRRAGRYEQAIGFYQKVLQLGKARTRTTNRSTWVAPEIASPRLSCLTKLTSVKWRMAYTAHRVPAITGRSKWK